MIPRPRSRWCEDAPETGSSAPCPRAGEGVTRSAYSGWRSSQARDERALDRDAVARGSRRLEDVAGHRGADPPPGELLGDLRVEQDPARAHEPVLDEAGEPVAQRCLETHALGTIGDGEGRLGHALDDTRAAGNRSCGRPNRRAPRQPGGSPRRFRGVFTPSSRPLARVGSSSGALAAARQETHSKGVDVHMGFFRVLGGIVLAVLVVGLAGAIFQTGYLAGVAADGGHRSSLVRATVGASVGASAAGCSACSAPSSSSSSSSASSGRSSGAAIVASGADLAAAGAPAAGARVRPRWTSVRSVGGPGARGPRRMAPPPGVPETRATPRRAASAAGPRLGHRRAIPPDGPSPLRWPGTALPSRASAASVSPRHGLPCGPR